MNSNFLKAGLAAVLLLTFNQITSAQKLPSEQKVSVYAPAAVQIDGKPTEWAGKFQAKNSATQLTYVMANDEENLYLVIQTNEKLALNKIFFDGISLIIKSNTNKKITPLKITYPVVSRAQRSNVATPLRDRSANTDSIVLAVNTGLGQTAKTIDLAGFTTITDPDVSVYNDFGIKAGAQFDNTRTMTFEYCLPIKYFKHLLDNNSSFDYSIVVNGVIPKPATGSAPVSAVAGASVGGFIMVTGGPSPDISNPTDLTASYTLAKK